MRKITIDLNSYSKYTIFENTVRQGENLATEVEFLLSTEFTGYKYLMMFQLNNKTPVSTSELTPIYDKVSYIITNAVTNEPGTLRVELHAYDLDTDALIKTAYVNLKVAQSLNGNTEVMPEAYVPWYIQAVEQASIATTKAAEAESSANKALTSENNAKTSETNANTSENNAKAFENNVIALESNVSTMHDDILNNYDTSEHLVSAMPHQAKDLQSTKTFRFGLQKSVDGNPQIIFEEV